MALAFAVNNDRVTHTSSALDNPTACTILGWFYPTDDTARQYLCGHDAAGNEYGITWRADLAGDNFECGRQRATTDVAAQAAAANFTAYGLNKWLFIVFRFDTGGVNGDQQMLMGDFTTLAVGPSSYVAQSVGSGTPASVAGNLQVGNGIVTTREFHGRVGFFGYWNRYLTLTEIYQQQFRPRPTANCALFCHYGLVGTGTQPDWSGNGVTGTVTGATVVDHVPLGGLFGGTRRRGYVVAAGGTLSVNLAGRGGLAGVGGLAGQGGGLVA